VNVFINFVAWDKVRQAARGQRSVIMDAQHAARRARLLSSLVVQATMTGAAVTKDPLIVAWLDAAGALVVSAIMVRAALRLLGEAVPDLVDRSANYIAAPALGQGAALLPSGMTIDAFSSRGTARSFVLEVALGCAPATELATIRTAARILADELARTLPGVDIRLQVNAVSVDVGRS
jgi:divalent metal cation (Fe/Co/Zn/Cd) transporter